MFLNTDNQQNFEINQLLIGKLRIDFTSIILIDKSDKIEGNGFLYQNDNRELKIVFFRKITLQENQELELELKKRDGGGGLKKSTCEVKALDKNGVSYSAFCHFYPAFSQNVEEIKIYKLKADKVGQVNRILFRGNYKIPSNSEYTTIATYMPYKESVVFGFDNKIESIINSFEERACEKRGMWKIKLSEDIELNLCQFQNYLELLILTHQILNDEILNKIIHTLDFLIGNITQMVFYSMKDIGACYYSFNSVYPIDVSMTPPLLTSGEPRIKGDYSNLFNSYYQFINKLNNKDYKKLLKCHRRIVAASRLYLFNFGQSLAIQIEYLASEFLSNYKLKLIDDPTFKDDIKSLINFVKEDFELKHSNSKEWIINRLEPGTSKEKWSKAKLLKQLIEDKAVYGIYSSWNQLRNSAAHGSDNNSKEEELIERVYDCLEIYYTMIYFIIGYEGNYSRLDINNYAKDKKYKLPESKNEKSASN
jgi:hypothetical protein